MQDAVHGAERAAEGAGRSHASERLASAQRQTYGLHPDPSAAVAEAIRAVEAATIPVVLPASRRPNATLGTVIRELDPARGQPPGWRIALVDRQGQDDIGPVVEMLRLLWRGHTDRHEGEQPAQPVTQAAAEAAVPLAATLVHWFTTSAIAAPISSP